MMATDNIMKNQLTISLLSILMRQTPNPRRATAGSSLPPNKYLCLYFRALEIVVSFVSIRNYSKMGNLDLPRNSRRYLLQTRTGSTVSIYISLFISVDNIHFFTKERLSY